MLLKRLAVWGISMALGFAVAAFIVMVLLPTVPVQNGVPISIEKYGFQYFFWTGFPIGLIFVVWIDGLVNSRILPD
jgi:hypothetical protein